MTFALIIKDVVLLYSGVEVKYPDGRRTEMYRPKEPVGVQKYPSIDPGGMFTHQNSM